MRYYYNATFGQNTTDHVLGNLAVGEPALNFTEMGDQEIIDYILEELDTIYDNQATSSYLEGFVQDWSDEVFVRGAYTFLGQDDDEYLFSVVGTLRNPMGNNRLFLAGEAIPAGTYFAEAWCVLTHF